MEKKGDAFDMDDFWAIEKLVPKKEKPVVLRRSSDISAIEITSDLTNNPGGGKAEDALTVKYVPRRREPAAPDDEYEPSSPLIGSVKIYRWKNSYNYYEEFRRDALRLCKRSGRPSAHVAFFSYVPQYVQLSDAQLEYYLYFRECVRAGACPRETDYSYVLLLIYEIINLGGDADVKEGQELLCRIWEGYRDVYPRLDRYLADWICDYSLIHHLPPPVGICDRGLADNSTLKEFYVYYGKGEGISLGYAHALMRFCSGYDYKKSKFAAGENLALYDEHLAGALARVIETCSDGGQLLSAAALTENRITRDAYSGALCASEMKRRLEISFCSFSRSHELRFLVADVLKYAENRLRGYLGVKSKLSVFGIPKPLADAVDAYFNEKLPQRRREKETSADTIEKEPYAKLYDAPSSPLSEENAAKIEERSWGTTKILVEAFDMEEESGTSTSPAKEVLTAPVLDSLPEEEVSDKERLYALFDADMLAFVRAALVGDVLAEERIAGKQGKLKDAFADEINGIAADVIGDVILEDIGVGYAVIEDYRELFEDDR